MILSQSTSLATIPSVRDQRLHRRNNELLPAIRRRNPDCASRGHNQTQLVPSQSLIQNHATQPRTAIPRLRVKQIVLASRGHDQGLSQPQSRKKQFVEDRVLKLCKRFLAGATLLAIMFFLSPEGGASGANSKRPGDVVLLDCGATWCGPCRSMAPIVNEVAGLGWTIRHVDVDQEKELVRRFSITGIPCYIVLVEGQEVGRITGATTRVELETLLTRSSQTPSSIASLPALVSPASLPNSRAIPGIPFPATTTTETLAIESVDQSTRRTVEPMLPNAIAPSSRTIPMPVAHQAAPVSKSISDKVDRERVNAALAIQIKQRRIPNQSQSYKQNRNLNRNFFVQQHVCELKTDRECHGELVRLLIVDRVRHWC